MTEALTQGEADRLLGIEKHAAKDDVVHYPRPGDRVNVPLISVDRREEFLLDIYRGRVNLGKGTYQNRARVVIVLARLDFGGAPHTNPDGDRIGVPHLHVYREGFADKWAYPLPDGQFSDPDDWWALLEDFMTYCNITPPPNIPRPLFR